MNRKEAKELLPIIQAFAEGKKIEYSDDGVHWVETEIPTWDSDLIYRIKPESKYRPFKTQEECWNEMHKHPDFGWVTDKCKYVHIVCVRQGNIEFNPDTDDNVLYSCIMTFADVLEQGYTFVDGTPFGIREE